MAFVSAPVGAQQLGREYSMLPSALPKEAPDKIEMIEFFSYACPHCNALNPFIAEWAAKLPSDVYFRKEAVSFDSPFYLLTAKLFYALEAIGEEKRLDSAVFNAIHKDRVKLIDEKSVTAWVAAQGIDQKKFSEASSSFSVTSRIARSDKLVEQANLPGVPVLVVDGRFLVGGPGITSYPQMLSVADQLVAKARAERVSAKK
ncbi:thiol:disulfide interchange protein DsbA/DsbL [Propionivibrio soli]|uniref:thiol:disulfide interchange protein DsbA/DsbL n=1 Tax=Propionivibrio soli TaxID=2976531 RepID=UPI0021E98E5F|nr:thiol:disulfide interchange protein DsbA/DsbL [Propionivibrio soli]